ncbi:MAG: hydroxyisourate hydrolase [Oceanospirillaceae bacterium]
MINTSTATGYLTTHVLDTANGCPGNAIPVALYRLTATRELLLKTVTNDDGRCDQPLLKEAAFTVGKYELVFNVADYYTAKGVQLAEPPFLDEIVLRFAIADPSAHYHVPLLVSPYSFSTYRGS